MDKTGSRTPAHLGFNNQSSSSNSLPTNGHQRQRLWDMEANPSKVLHPSWDKKHRLPHQTPEAIFWRTSFWRSLCIMEFEVNRYERESTVTIPDSVKIAILHNETQGALQQHLQLTASSTRDYNPVREIIIECYRATASFWRMQQLQSYDPNTANQHRTSWLKQSWLTLVTNITVIESSWITMAILHYFMATHATPPSQSPDGGE